MTDIEEKVASFFSKYPKRSFPKGQVMVHAGEEPAGIFYLLDGLVNQYDISPGGTEVVVNVFKPRAFFPLSWAINNVPNQYFWGAGTKVTVRIAPADDVVAFLHREPDVLFDLLARVYRGVDGLLRRQAHLMGGDARSRLVFEIVNAAYRFGTTGKDGQVHLPLKEGELAKHSGLARETVSRLVQGLKSAGLIEVAKTGLVLPDIERLELILGSDL